MQIRWEKWSFFLASCDNVAKVSNLTLTSFSSQSLSVKPFFLATNRSMSSHVNLGWEIKYTNAKQCVRDGITQPQLDEKCKDQTKQTLNLLARETRSKREIHYQQVVDFAPLELPPLDNDKKTQYSFSYLLQTRPDRHINYQNTPSP